jgi:hypothetical protein
LTAAKLKLTGRCDAWHADVREGKLVHAGGDPMAVLVRPVPGLEAGREALAALREEARLLSRIRHQNVLRVVHVTSVGGQAALVHEACGGIGLARALALLAERRERMPLRAVAELVCTVATAVDAACVKLPGQREARVIHPGPAPEDVLIDGLGRIRVAGFRVAAPGRPLPPCPEGFSPPEGLQPGPATAYGTAALLVVLLTEEPVLPAGERHEAHEAMLRRTSIRIAAKVVHEGWEDLTRIVRQAMHHDPQARLSPAELAHELRSHALRHHSPGLRAWAPAAVPGLLRRLEPHEAHAERAPDPDLVPEGVAARPPLGFSPPPELPSEVEEMATEVVSPAVAERLRAEPAEPTLPHLEEPRAAPAVLAPPPSLPERDSSAIREGRPPLAATVLPLPRPAPGPPAPHPAVSGKALVVEVLVQDSPTEEIREPRTDEVPTREVPRKPPPPPPEVRSIVPEAPDHFGPLEEHEDPPARRRGGALWLLLPLAAAALLGGVWAGLQVLPRLLPHVANDAPEQVGASRDLADLLEPAPSPEKPQAPEGLEGIPAPGEDGLAEAPALPEPANGSEPGPTEPAQAEPPLAPPAPAPPAPHPIAPPATRADAIAALTPPPPEPAAQPEPAAHPEPAASPPPVTHADPGPHDRIEPEEPEEPEILVGTDVPDKPPPAPPTAVLMPPPISQAPVSAESFRVEFRSAMPDVFEIEVRCHQGSGKGPSPVVLNDAGKGPCRITGLSSQAGRLVAWFALTGPGTVTCFGDGQRLCK